MNETINSLVAIFEYCITTNSNVTVYASCTHRAQDLYEKFSQIVNDNITPNLNKFAITFNNIERWVNINGATVHFKDASKNKKLKHTIKGPRVKVVETTHTKQLQ
jgi:hypothetical protein